MTANLTRYRGERIYLRELVDADINERYLGWFRDARVTSFLEARDLTQEQVLDYIEEGRGTGAYYMFAICLIDEDLHIGNLKLGPILHKHGLSDLVTVIGDSRYWGQGLATEAIRIGTQMAFDIYGIRKLSGDIYSGNVGSIKCYTRAGWTIEATLRGHYLSDEGEPMDAVCVSCFNPQYFPANAR